VHPKVRPAVYDTYWRLAAERQRIFHLRAEGQPAPWTDDRILASYKFCNTYRASDRISQYLIREVIYGSDDDPSAEDLLLRIIFFRLFSKEETWQAVERRVGLLSVKDFDAAAIDQCLEEHLLAGTSIYTSAFILCANRAYGHARKHRNHLALLEAMFGSGRLPRTIAAVRSLQELYDALLEWPLLGPFMAYQLAIDINYSELVDFSEDEFTVAGPGALRGLRKCFVDAGGLSPDALICHMVHRQDAEFARLGIPFQDLFGRRLHAIDCQGLFCELDKYARVAFPELKSNRVRIKARFAPTPRPLSLFYPPKWGLNGRLPASDPDRQASPGDRTERQATLAAGRTESQLGLVA
jgi:5-hmdU DNA kinase-like protein